LTESELFRAIRAEADRLHLDESVLVVDAPLEDCEEGWWVGYDDQSEMPMGCVGATLGEALLALLDALRKIDA
jgi:hypothetical protein